MMAAFWLAFLAAPPPKWDPVFFWAALPLVGLLLIGAVIIAWVKKRWREPPPEEHLSASDQLAEFRILYERGELSAEEFARIRTRLTARMKKELGAHGLVPEDAPPGADSPPGAETNPQDGAITSKPPPPPAPPA